MSPHRQADDMTFPALPRLLLAGPIAAALLASGGQPAQAACTPRPLNRHEAIAALRLVPDAVLARREGATLSVYPWRIGPIQSGHLYWSFMLVREPPGHTFAENGILGYFSVDRRTARVTDVNSNAVNSAALDRYRRRMLRTHCLSR
jgi:hypothetical protein